MFFSGRPERLPRLNLPPKVFLQQKVPSVTAGNCVQAKDTFLVRRMKWTMLIRRIARCVLPISLQIVVTAGGGAQTAKQPTPPAVSAQPTPQASANLRPIQLDGNEVLHHLNQAIGWYRHSTSGIRDVGLPSDAIYQDSAKALGAQAVQLAFQSAKAESAVILAQQGGAANQSSPENTQQQRMEQLRAKTTAQIDQIQKQIEELNTKIPRTPASKRATLISQREALQAQLELQKSLLDAVQKMSSFIESNAESGRGLEGDINRLAQSVPEVLGTRIVTRPP